MKTRLVALLCQVMAAMAIVTIPAARASAASTIESEFAVAGPYATTTGSYTDSGGRSYTLYYPSSYSALGFKSPIVTWGNGTNASPSMYSTLLSHLASWGFTIIGSNLANTGSGNEIADGANDMIALNSTSGSGFYGNLDTLHVAAVGHSQGAGGSVNAANNDSAITAVMTFSLPNTQWVGTNPDCPTKSVCMYYPNKLTVPIFFVSTHGFLDSIIASPSTETAFYNSVPGKAALGIITNSGGKAADHNSIQNTANGGNPAGELGYPTAWLLYELRGNSTAKGAFSGASPELLTNSNWPGSLTKA